MPVSTVQPAIPAKKKSKSHPAAPILCFEFDRSKLGSTDFGVVGPKRAELRSANARESKTSRAPVPVPSPHLREAETPIDDAVSSGSMTASRLARARPDRISGRRVAGRHPEHRSERCRDPFHLRLGDPSSRPPPELVRPGLDRARRADKDARRDHRPGLGTPSRFDRRLGADPRDVLLLPDPARRPAERGARLEREAVRGRGQDEAARRHPHDDDEGEGAAQDAHADGHKGQDAEYPLRTTVSCAASDRATVFDHEIGPRCQIARIAPDSSLSSHRAARRN